LLPRPEPLDLIHADRALPIVQAYESVGTCRAGNEFGSAAEFLRSSQTGSFPLLFFAEALQRLFLVFKYAAKMRKSQKFKNVVNRFVHIREADVSFVISNFIKHPHDDSEARAGNI